MPSKIVDLSARSAIIKDEPFHVHFWECTPDEFLAYLKDPQKTLRSMGIEIPETCRVETTIENHDWIGAHTKGLSGSNGGTIICNVGGGNIARSVYRVVSYGHFHDAVGRHDKTLLHGENEQERKQ